MYFKYKYLPVYATYKDITDNYDKLVEKTPTINTFEINKMYYISRKDGEYKKILVKSKKGNTIEFIYVLAKGKKYGKTFKQKIKVDKIMYVYELVKMRNIEYAFNILKVCEKYNVHSDICSNIYEFI